MTDMPIKIPTLAEVEAHLIAKGWSPKRVARALADAAGVDHTTYRRWRTGGVQPMLASWERILKAVAKIEGKGVRDGERLATMRRKSIARARSFRRIEQPDSTKARKNAQRSHRKEASARDRQRVRRRASKEARRKNRAKDHVS